MLVESDLAEIYLVDLLLRPESLSVPYVDGDERIRRQLEQLLLFAGQPFSLVFHLPTLLIILLTRIHVIGFLSSMHFLIRRTGEHQVILSHSHEQTPLSKVILHYENLVSFDQDNGVVSSDLTECF